MKLCFNALFTIFALFAFAKAVAVDRTRSLSPLSELSVSENSDGAENTQNLSTRGIVRLTLCANPNYDWCETYSLNTGGCYRIPERYERNLRSARTSASSVCDLYEGGDCNGNSLFVHPNGPNDIREVRSYVSGRCRYT